MYIHLSESDGLPLYLQIIRQIKYQIATETLRPGDKLPSIRDLAVQIRVNPTTIAQAYRELEREGALETNRGRGTFVSDKGINLAAKEKKALIEEQVDRLLVEAKHLDIPVEKIQKIIKDRRKKFNLMQGGK